MVASIQTKGFDQLILGLRRLPGKPMRAVLRKGIRAQTAEVRKAVKRKTPRETGALKRAIGSRVVTTRDKRIVGIVGARRGEGFTVRGPDGKKRVPVNYIHLVELGTAHSAPVGMLRSGLNSSIGSQRAAFLAKAKPEFEKQVKRLRDKRATTIVSGAEQLFSFATGVL